MNAITLTTIIGLVIGAVGTILLPVFLNRSKNKQSRGVQDTLDSRNVAQMFKDERDRLQLRLDTMQAEYERRMMTLNKDYQIALEAAESKWKIVHDRDQQQITELRAELQQLYRQLYKQNP